MLIVQQAIHRELIGVSVFAAQVGMPKSVSDVVWGTIICAILLTVLPTLVWVVVRLLARKKRLAFLRASVSLLAAATVSSVLAIAPILAHDNLGIATGIAFLAVDGILVISAVVAAILVE